MESDLEGRNNRRCTPPGADRTPRLNEVRPRRPEQCQGLLRENLRLVVSMKSGLEGRNNGGPGRMVGGFRGVSMKSGLEGRNNPSNPAPSSRPPTCLNEVRPRRPEQSRQRSRSTGHVSASLNEVRPRRPEQFDITTEKGRANSLNEVRPRRPEQLGDTEIY